MFYCLCYVKEIPTDILEEQVLEEIDPEMNDEGGIRTECSWGKNWRDVADDG